MYYHTSSELGIEVTNRLQLQEENMRADECQLDNCGKMSFNDSLKEVHLTEKRIMNFINELSNKVTEVGINPLVSIPFISKRLNIPEEVIILTLKSNGVELTTVEEEDE